MRRSRISVKPNFRPGSRIGTEGEHVSQGVKEAGVTLPAIKANEVARPAASQQQNITFKEPSEDVGIKDAAEVFSNTNQNDEAPSSGVTTSSTAPHRRMRISAAPKLVAPKITSTPRARPSASLPSSAPLSQSNEEQVKIHDSASEAQVSSPVISNDVPKSGTPRKSTSPTNLPTQSLSPCFPSTSGLPKSLVRGKKSVEDSPPSPQPGQVPQQPPQELEPPEHPCSTDMPSVCIKPLNFDKSSSSETTEKSSDTDRIIRALKLKELMKIERKKDIQMVKRKVGHKEFTGLDRSKMTMRDLIYYLPNTSPMRSSVVQEENQEETIIPPSPKQQIKTAEKDYDDEEEEAESENEEMLVPKVRVAEDGSIILDEESLTVRVQRTSTTKLVENSMFERGSTTTYSSFRTLKHVKTWSVRETDLFFLAINMVGTDFSLIGQLLTHRSRAEIKSKFKKEEKVNPWRIDKALRNMRPYDKEFFSYLLEKILAKDKDKRKSVKLILPKTRKPRKSKGNKASEHRVSGDDDDDVFHMDNQKNLEHDGDLGVEKENEDLSNVKETESSVPAKKKCKRARAVSEDKDEDCSTTEQVKRKKQRKCNKNKKRDAKDDTEAESELIAQGDTINLNKEDELNKRNTSKRRSKHSNSGGDKENEKGVKVTKRKQLKKSCKVISDNEESNVEHEASSIMDEDGCTTKKKRKRAEKSDLNEDEPAKRKKNTKRKKALKSTIEDDDTAEEGEGALEDLQEAEKLNAPVTAEVVDNGSSQTSRRSKKVLPNLATRRNKKSCEPEAFPDVEGESQDANNPESTLTVADSPLEDERLQMQAVVVLEKTPPRQQNLLSPSKVKCKTDELEPSGGSPTSSYSSEGSCAQQTRIQRAGKVKRDLSNSGKKGQGMLDQDETDLVSPVVLLERLTQEPEYEADDLSLNENLTDLSCLRDLHSPMFQRRPMVLLSRDEVDRILDASDQSADEEPSVSPLDLSLNTELSFPLRCSKILDDNDDYDEAEVDCGFEEHEERTNEGATSEERNCEELEQAESVSAEPAISNLKDISTSLKPEACSQPKVPLSNIRPSSPIEEGEPEGQPMTCKDVTSVATVVESSPTLDIQDNLDPVCTNPDAPMPQETVTTETAMLGTSLGVSDIMEKSESSISPILASSEITEESKLTLTGSLSESQRSQEATPEFNAGLKRSLEGPLHTLESLQGSSESKEDTQESANSEINTSTQDVTRTQEVKVDSQEKVSASSSASASSEHGTQLTRRSKFLKPKPNLSQRSRSTALQNQRRDPKTHSTQKPKSSETEVSKETLLYSPANDQHGALEDLSNQNRTAEEETSLSKAVDQMESESTKDVGDGSTAVPDKKAITTLAAIDDDPPMASQSSSRTCDVDRITPCSSLTSPQPLRPGESTGTDERVISSEDVCAPAEILHVNDDGHNDEEPTFILTLYEIPITQSHLTSSSNDYEMTSDLATVETQAFLGLSDQAHVLPCRSESSRINSPLMEGSGTENDLDVISEDLSENGKEKITAQFTSQVISSPHARSVDCDASSLEMYIPPNDPDLGCKKGSEFSPLDLALAPSVISVSNCITPSPQDSDDSKQLLDESVSHSLLGDVFVPVSEETGDDSNENRTMAVESKLQSKDTFSANVTEDLAANVSELASSHEPILLYTKDKQSDACANQETDAPHTDRESEHKKGSDLAPLEDLASRTQSTLSGFNITKSITTLPQDSEDKEQFDGVSHTVLADIFVPVSEEMGDNSSKEASSASVTDNLAENVKEKISELMTAPEPILLDTKDEEEKKNFENMETGISHLDPNSESKEGLKISPLDDSLFRNQNKPFGFSVSKCIEALPQNPKDTEQFEHVSHMLLTDVFVPVSEETGDDSNKDRTQVIEEKSHSKEPSTVSVPQRQDTPYEDSTEESKDTPGSSEEQKAPARRRARQIKPQPKLVKRTRGKDDASKTDELVMEPSHPSSSRVFLPARHEKNLAGISNTIDKKPVGTMSSIKGIQTCVDGEGKKEVPKSITAESPKMSQGDLDITESKPISTLLHKSEDFKLEEERNENVTGETAVKDDMESSAEDKELSIPANVQPCCEDMVSGSSAVDSEETVAGTQGVCHMVLPDVFVLVSDEMEDDLCIESLESSPQRDSLSKKSSTHFEKELKTEDLSQTFVEKSTQDQSALVDIKTPVRKRGKQEVKTTFTRTDSNVSQPTSPQATAPSSQLTTLPQNENIVLLEEKLKRRHQIMPCTVRLSSLDTVGQRISSPRLEDRKDNDQRSSPTCHASVTNLSEESNTPSLFEKKSLQEAESEKTRSKGKKNESSPDTTHGHLKPVQTLGQTRQLTITDWLKKKSPATKQEGEKEPKTSSHVQSCLKIKGMHEAMVEKTKDSEEPKGSHLEPALEKNEEVSSVIKEVKMSSEVVKKSNDDPPVSQVKKSPPRRRAKLQVKPKLLKRASTSEGDTSTPDPPQPTLFTSTRQHARAAREKKESENKNEQPVKELPNTSSVEENSEKNRSLTSGPQSPISQDTWPRVVLPRVKLWTTEAGVSSASSTPTSSPARVSQSVSPPQLKKSPTQSRSPPTDSENPDDDPSRVSQFFLSDIFTEVEEAE